MLRFTYKKQNLLITKEGKGYKIKFTKEDVGVDENDPTIKKLVLNSYNDVLKILKKEHWVQYEKTFYNMFSEDEQYFTIIRKCPKGIECLFIYKFENDEIKNVFKMLMNNELSTATFGTIENGYIWCILPDVLNTIITAKVLAKNGEVLFEQHSKKKRNGKVRIYYAPHEDIKTCLRSLNGLFQNIYDQKNIEFQVAYKKGKSVYDNAKIHKDNKYVYNLDLKDFYPSCKTELVRKYVEFLFKSVPGKDATLNEFLNIITINGGLFIGSPISGCLANTILSQPVKYIKNMCEKNNMKFSIYADDMSFSGDKKITKQQVESMFNEAFVTYHLDSYFTLNDEKAIGYTGMKRKVTGVSINGNNELTTKRKYYRELRTLIDHLSKDDGSDIDVNKLRGKIAYALMIDDSGKFYRYLQKYLSTVKQYSLCSDERLKELSKRFN